MSFAAVAPSPSSRTRESAPAVLVRDSDAVRTPRTRLASERPASIREAIVRWLDQEL
ncbi:hypothetical protein JY651_10105 [Pyxidicoccus parkwayensis]|uniref:Uncharacterized protein n=1 Tax=Pyxidicoccus parkwayensis TaxID=2813578 RepID=A0ABX7P477_9BACT|nr:hypothetical protein [Pyxidicoccus parkwaysis]QSQ25251.1 hypothetical protein JY651_10105 [Pyxidicoccus parkwaysis]